MSDQSRWLHITVPDGQGTRMCDACNQRADDVYLSPMPFHVILLCARCAGELVAAVARAGQREETTGRSVQCGTCGTWNERDPDVFTCWRCGGKLRDSRREEIGHNA